MTSTFRASPPSRPDTAHPDTRIDAAPARLPAQDNEAWFLRNRIETLHQAQRALHALVRRGSSAARVVSVAPLDAARRPPVSTARFDPGTVAPWPDRPLPDQPLMPPPGLGCYTLGQVDCAVVGVCVLGLRGADLEHAVAAVAEEQRRGMDFKPVFLTDGTDFSPMFQRGFVVEYIPDQALPRDALGLPPARHAFLTRKWGISRLIDLRHLRAPAALPAAPPAAPPLALPATATRATPARRRRAAVIAWDMAHNPVGRAMVLYDLLARDWDVELVGPIWSRYGRSVWGPIADSARKVRAFPCDTLEQFWPAALALAAAADYDLVVVCKPRLPSLLLGALVKQACGCPLVLDIDDFELSFFKDETPASLDDLAAAGPEALAEPYGELATRACDGVIPDADAVVVSNVALRNRFGGIILRHARDEDLFHPGRLDRDAERQRMGMSQDDFAIVFVGTARAHKGVFDIARTLAALPDKRFVLHLVGDIPDRRIRADLDRYHGARIVFHPDCPFEDLPARLIAADAVVLLQDVAHPISQYQIPAKVSDASALGLPILATDVPPMRDLALQGVVRLTTPADLGAALGGLIADRDARRSDADRRLVREAFETELGFRVNRERLDLAIARAAAAGPGLPPSHARLIDIAAQAHAALRSRRTAPALPARPRRTPARGAAQIDIAMFWKQNDTGLYGRRSDMLMKYLLASGRVGRVVQFDAPLDLRDLAALSDPARGSAAALILANTIDNQFGLRDRPGHALRTFLWDRKGRGSPVLPHVGRSLADYPDFVAAEMARAGLRAENTLAWVCPVVFDFPAIAARIPFRGIIGDLIDDQRCFAMSEAYRAKIIASYQATLPLFDLTFTNCAAQVAAFADLARDIRIVPNGTELPARDDTPVPPALAALPRPIAGYVGNLRDRIDWHLLRDTALLLPQVSFAIVGGGARPEDAARVADLPNVTFVGVVPYDQVQACIRMFDVALVPHLRNHLTASMNPLKIYSYFAADRPIVSTEVDNVDADLMPYIRFADDPSRFAAAILAAASAPPCPDKARATVLAGITWNSRVRSVLAAIDETFGPGR